MIWKAALFIAAVASGVSSQFCPNGYLDFAEVGQAPICMRLASDRKATWSVWQSLCNAEGARLATLKGDLHAKIYQHIMADQDMWNEAFWVGASDIMSEGDWVWVSDGSSVDMGTPHWDPCSPAQPDGGTAQNYMCLWTPNFYFSSCLDTVEIYAICQV